MIKSEIIYDILERARWAPSGDNSQPWKFEIKEYGILKIHLFQNPNDIYEFAQGRTIWISAGTLIECIRLVALTKKINCHIYAVHGFVDGIGSVELAFDEDDGLVSDPLEAFIETRSVQRKAFYTRDINEKIERALSDSLGDKFSLSWYRTISERWKITKLNMKATWIRLSIHETYDVHKKIIDWDKDFSPTGIPAKALGMTFMTLMITKWAMKNWKRFSFLMKYFGGTIIPRFEMDMIPGMFCARHFMIECHQESDKNSPEFWMDLGSAVQRFWLCATQHGVALQPGLVAIIFAKYVGEGIKFTENQAVLNVANDLFKNVEMVTHSPVGNLLFAGRIGFSRVNQDSVMPRSIRLPLKDMMIRNGNT